MKKTFLTALLISGTTLFAGHDIAPIYDYDAMDESSAAAAVPVVQIPQTQTITLKSIQHKKTYQLSGGGESLASCCGTEFGLGIRAEKYLTPLWSLQAAIDYTFNKKCSKYGNESKYRSYTRPSLRRVVDYNVGIYTLNAVRRFSFAEGNTHLLALGGLGYKLPGETKCKNCGIKKEFVADAGLGVEQKMLKSIFAYADAKMIYGLNSNNTGMVYSVGIGKSFEKTEETSQVIALRPVAPIPTPPVVKEAPVSYEGDVTRDVSMPDVSMTAHREYFVQTGAYSSMDNAEAALMKLSEDGVENGEIRLKGRHYAVLVPYSEEEAGRLKILYPDSFKTSMVIYR